jgi:hypothetical protein
MPEDPRQGARGLGAGVEDVSPEEIAEADGDVDIGKGADRVEACGGGGVSAIAVAETTREEGRDGEGLRDGGGPPGQRGEAAVGAGEGGLVLVRGPLRGRGTQRSSKGTAASARAWRRG